MRDRFDFGVGGPAEFVTSATSIEDLVRAVSAAEALSLPYLVVGRGGQTVFSDYGFPGLVIVNRSERIEFIPSSNQVLVDGGAVWPRVILRAAERGLGGIESMLMTQGTVAGTLSAGTFSPTGFQPKNNVRSLTVIRGQGQIARFRTLPLHEPLQKGFTILVVRLQLSAMRRDDLLRRIRRSELLRRRVSAPGRRWLGPVFFSEYQEADPTYLLSQFRRANVLGLAQGGAIFAEARPNYIEGRGRVTAQMVRKLVDQVYHRLSAALTDPPISRLQFVGMWPDENRMLS